MSINSTERFDQTAAIMGDWYKTDGTVVNMANTLAITNSSSVVSEQEFVWLSTATEGSTSAVSVIDDISTAAFLKEKYMINIENQSSESDVTVSIYVKEIFSSTDRWCYVTQASIPATPDTYSPDRTNFVSAMSLQVSGAMLAAGIGMKAILDSSITSAAVGSSELNNKVIIREM